MSTNLSALLSEAATATRAKEDRLDLSKFASFPDFFEALRAENEECTRKAGAVAKRYDNNWSHPDVKKHQQPMSRAKDIREADKLFCGGKLEEALMEMVVKAKQNTTLFNSLPDRVQKTLNEANRQIKEWHSIAGLPYIFIRTYQAMVDHTELQSLV